MQVVWQALLMLQLLGPRVPVKRIGGCFHGEATAIASSVRVPNSMKHDGE